MTHLIQIAVGFLIGGCLSAFVHELGHALMARRMGYEVTSFGLGLLRPLLVFNWLGARVYFCWQNLDRGLTFAIYPAGVLSRGRQVGFLAGGILANLLLALVSLACAYAIPPAAVFWLSLTAVNLLLAFCSLLPIPSLGWLTVATDGSQILRLLRGKSSSWSGAELFHTLHLFRPHWQAIGDQRMEAHCLLAASGNWRLLGDEQRAEELFREAEALSENASPTTAAALELTRADAHQKAGRLAEAAKACARAREEFAANGSRNGELAAVCLLAALAEAMGQPTEADHRLAEAEANPLLADSPGLRPLVLASRLDIQGQRLTTEQLEQLQADHESLPPHCRQPEFDWLIYRKLARLLFQRQDWRRAQQSASSAFQAAVRLWQSMQVPDDRIRLVKLAGSFQEETAESLTRLGQQDAAEAVPNFLQEVSAIQEAASRSRRERQDYFYWRGLILTGINAVLAGLAIWCLQLNRPYSPLVSGLIFAGLAQFPFLLGQLILQPIYFLARRDPNNPMSYGGTTLLLAIAPWVALTVSAAAHTYRLFSTSP